METIEIVGRRVVDIRNQTQDEINNLGWYRGTKVIELDNGVLLFASRDEEGNDAGVLFGVDGDKEFLIVWDGIDHE